MLIVHNKLSGKILLTFSFLTLSVYLPIKRANWPVKDERHITTGQLTALRTQELELNLGISKNCSHFNIFFYIAL